MALNGTILLIGRAQPDQNPLRALGFDGARISRVFAESSRAKRLRNK
ncbi:MAG: hypothetical protein U0528_01620 [Anaerolineae bacterium]